MIPEGFTFSGINSGIKKRRKDLGLILGDEILDAVCFFTDNKFKAAPLLTSMEALEAADSQIKAIIVNSGNANCAMGEQGIKDAQEICTYFSEQIHTDCHFIHSSSTGIIGKRLEAKKIIDAFDHLIEESGKTKECLDNFSEAILTTDLVTKIVRKTVRLGTETITIMGVAKGSGMIQPQMSMHATMLAYIMTDATLCKTQFRESARKCIESSFNTITIDGCSSTNDSVFFLSSKKSRHKINSTSKYLKRFEKALNELCFDLAQKIVMDGEGATKCVTVRVTGAKNQLQAKNAGMVIANSMLVKTALYGKEPNIGRVIQILGQHGYVNHTWEPKIKLEEITDSKVDLIIDISQGETEWSVLTCDLTEDYIKINTRYT